jgi:ribosome maturation protein Sdo1
MNIKEIDELDPINIASVAASVSMVLDFESDDRLIEALGELRETWKNKDVWRAATLLLPSEKRSKLNKMVILQNVKNGIRVDIPSEHKTRPKPKRTPFSRELLAKVMV